MKLTRKKRCDNERERKHQQRVAFLKNLRQIVATEGSDNLVYFDESEFETNFFRPYAWSKQGHKIYGDIAILNDS